jgi:NADH-quinone oxidoreductase subunit C
MKDWIPAEWLKDIEPFGLAACDNEATGTTCNLFLQHERLREAARNLDKAGYFLEDITGLDGKEGFEFIYHFTKYDKPYRVTLRVLTVHENPVMPSISDIFEGADWHERECYDFFGVTFEGHPNLIPLLLPDNFGFHPLIKEEKKRVSLFESLSKCQTIGIPVPCAINPDESGDKE